MPELNTSSLPDLIFTILFFFMIVTTLREVTLKVQFRVGSHRQQNWKSLKRSHWFPSSTSVNHYLSSRKRWVLQTVSS